MEVKIRDERIDILKVLGIAMIILAHVNPPEFIFQLRNFDVPLMVLISGMSFGLSYKNESFLGYMWKRIKRLVFPVWIFLTAYFGLISIFDLQIEKLTYPILLQSYLLIGGIGYVWIIKVFLLVALVSPIIYQYNKNTKSTRTYLIGILVIFVLYEIISILSKSYFSSEMAKNLTQFTHYIVPYSLVFAIGLRMSIMDLRTVIFCTGTSFLIFAALFSCFWWFNGYVVFTQAHKYPPTIYYFSYALFMSFLAWLLAPYAVKIINYFKFVKRAVMFIAENSIWIYLWHIPLLKLIEANVLVKYILVFLLAALASSLQIWMVKSVLLKRITNLKSRKNIKMILTG